MYACFEVSAWIALPLSIIAAGFLVRIFIIQHDCGHGSFFKSRRALPSEDQAAILERVRAYDDFAPANDLYGEHDFGAFDYKDKRIFWKVDAYDRDLRYGSPDPADPRVTRRVLTIMLAGEY
jgi:hypothetical protein